MTLRRSGAGGGLVSDPGKYRWSGYGEATAGRQRAKEEIRRIYGLGVGTLEVTRTESLRGYRMRVFSQAGSEPAARAPGRSMRVFSQGLEGLEGTTSSG